MAKLGWPRRSTVVLSVAFVLHAAPGCRRMKASATHAVGPSTPTLTLTPAGVPTPALAAATRGGAPFSFEAPLAGVVDPWTWPRARGATERERAIEDIGPYEPSERGEPSAPTVNSNAHH